ncbi:MAG: hypothetical protein H6797_04510 [Candidatus Nomurabacteria bacterium]|nr:MAG: hypothetical protein H6797_04510 [Candidatus Nomurabacteria bacterium]
MKVVGTVVGVVGVLLLVAAVVVGLPVVSSALALSFSTVWSWATLQSLVGGVLGVHLARWGFDH